MTKRDLINELLRAGNDLDDAIVIRAHDGQRIGIMGVETLRESTPRVPGVVGLKLYREVSAIIPADSEVA
jgi:hypothetical protein